MKLLLGPIVLALGLSACGTAQRWVANTAEIEDRSVPGARLDWQRPQRPAVHDHLSSQMITCAGEALPIVAVKEEVALAENIGSSIASGPTYVEPRAQHRASACLMGLEDPARYHAKVMVRSTADESGPKSRGQVSTFSIAHCQRKHRIGTAIQAVNEDPTERPMNEVSRTAFVLGSISLAFVLLTPVFIFLSLIVGVLGIIGLVQALVRKERGLGFAIGAILTPLLAITLVYAVWSGT